MNLFKTFSVSLGRLPIFQKIALTYGGLFSVSLILISLFISGSTSFFFTNLNRKELKEVALSIEDYITSGNYVTQSSLREINTNYRVEINIIEYSYNGPIIEIKPVFSFSNDEVSRQISERIMLDNGENTGFKEISIDKQKINYYQKILKYDNRSYKIQTFSLIRQEEMQLRFLYIVFMIANLVGIIISFTIGSYVSKKMLEPIKKIRNTAERISIEDLSERIDVSGPNDDLKDLAITFNDMIDRLDKSFKKQTRFVSDASHELRTPIAVIQGYVNLIDRWGKSDPDVLQESIDSIKSETEHMNKLVKKLLFLAKSDQNKTQVQREIINLNDIGNEILKEIEIMEIKQIFKFDIIDDDVNIIGDYSLIKQLLWVLVENSIKYTNANKSISLEIYKDKQSAYICVKDNGRGIPDEDIPYIFDRFYRVDKSRNKDIPGTGLGLSIAKWIANQHNAKISVFSELDKGTSMIVTFSLYEK